MDGNWGWYTPITMPFFHGKYMGNTWEIHGKYMEIVHWNPYWALFYSTVSKVARAVEKHPKHLDGCHQNLRRAAVLRCCSSRALLQGRHLTWPFSTSWAAYIEMYRGIGQGLARWNQMDSDVLGKNRAPYIRPINSNLHPTWVDSHHQHHRIPIDKIRHPGRVPATVEALWPLSPELSKATAQKSWKPVSNHKQSGYGLYSSCHSSMLACFRIRRKWQISQHVSVRSKDSTKRRFVGASAPQVWNKYRSDFKNSKNNRSNCFLHVPFAKVGLHALRASCSPAANWATNCVVLCSTHQIGRVHQFDCPNFDPTFQEPR